MLKTQKKAQLYKDRKRLNLKLVLIYCLLLILFVSLIILL